MSSPELLSKILELRSLEALADEVAEEIQRYKDLLKTELKNRETDTVTVESYTVKSITIVTNRFDTTTFKKNNPETYYNYIRPITYDRLVISNT